MISYLLHALERERKNPVSTDKRQVATDALETLGTIIDETAARDAIHLAVEPVIAAHTLVAGEHVGVFGRQVVVTADGTWPIYGRCDNPLGIVDPFLSHPVKEGERFWLVVYPRQVTSLRHVWTHPAFDAVKPEPKPEPKPVVAEAVTVPMASMYNDDDDDRDGCIGMGCRS